MLHQLKTTTPILFPNSEEVARAEARRSAAHYAAQARQVEALNAATGDGREQGFREGYVAGASTGMWTGLLVGCISTGVIAVFAHFVHAWAVAQ